MSRILLISLVLQFLLNCPPFSFAQFQIPDRNFEFRPGDWTGFSTGRFITSIHRGQIHLYIGTTHGLLRYQFLSQYWEKPWTVSDGLADDYIYAVQYDFKTGMVWCLTREGLSGRVSSSAQWQNIPYAEIGTTVRAIDLGLGKEFIWLKTPKKILKGDRDMGLFSQSDLQEAEQDQVEWSTDRDMNVSQLSHFFMEHKYTFFEEGYIQDLNLRQYQITKAVPDDFDNLWMGTWGLGMAHGDMQTVFLELKPYGLFSPDVQAMAWDGDGMWIGGQPYRGEGGITYWDLEENTWEYFESEIIFRLRSDRISSILPMDDAIYFGTDAGLARLDREKNEWRNYRVRDGLFDNRVTALAATESKLWIGTVYGISCIRLQGMVFSMIQDPLLKHRHIYHLEPDGNDLWAATDRGVFQYVSDENQWYYIENAPGMISQEAYSISIYDDEVWVATDGGVQMWRHSKEEWTTFPEGHFDTGGVIYNILADEKAVWIGTDVGVVKYFKEEDRWRRFTTKDGLLHNSVYWILLDGNDVWFGTGRGLCKFFWNTPYRID